ncbi:MAG: L,D-transpeptidase family protein [Bacteroidetes bacterium]|nr:L,D-transpeptidase family protein [Bacteroidota bacterium]
MKTLVKTTVVIILLSLFSIPVFSQGSGFKDQQKKYARVRQAYNDKYDYIDNLLKEKGIKQFHYELFIMTYKAEQIVEVWVRPKEKKEFILLVSYDICSPSGDLGPKRKQGDLQVPEGFYKIDRFNPASNFYLSLGVNYPNASDKIRGNRVTPGGDIFIHGNCVTIGCIPLTDNIIKELYLLAIEAKDNGQDKIRVFMLPFKMTDENMNENKNNPHYSFWTELQPAYSYFMKNKLLPTIRIDGQGKYLINP